MASTGQEFVGTGCFDRVMHRITAGASSLEAMQGSPEKSRF